MQSHFATGQDQTQWRDTDGKPLLAEGLAENNLWDDYKGDKKGKKGGLHVDLD